MFKKQYNSIFFKHDYELELDRYVYKTFFSNYEREGYFHKKLGLSLKNKGLNVRRKEYQMGFLVNKYSHDEWNFGLLCHRAAFVNKSSTCFTRFKQNMMHFPRESQMV